MYKRQGMGRVRLALLLALTSSLHFRFHLNLSLKDGQAEEKIMALQNTSQDLARAITPAQVAGHP